MKIPKSFIVIAVPLAMANVANARQVEVSAFTASNGEFRLLEPGRTPSTSADTAAVSSARLDSEFEALAPETITDSGPSLVASMNIPSWMKGRASSTDVTAPLASNASITACGPVPYAPHPALNAAQELRRQRYFGQMATAACGAGVPVDLFDALIIQESRYNPLAISSKGASGLTQLMPGTATSLGVFDRWSVVQNLDGGARYLRKQLDTFGNWALALGAYNAGPGNVMKYGGLPPFRETRGYVRAILSSVSTYQLRQRSGIGLASQPSRGVTLAWFNR
ncbi:lytic transglycosylase domain-containing protein [Novosphingobium sp. JCM 18896]|uniref:lytic transglycosylase domain-containing protein n=1 Tax=Novosphingobium sp. JCM 18896 TaxID=2989731 RepID=UPI002223B79B|nr:lytic transglycosylase domain-containing protein [Novosphingobium sp. JCM 18896]MCW1432028.1 lytic transglycosylase domain-containing protein [Novosphingobium sp. JCM 18896]